MEGKIKQKTKKGKNRFIFELFMKFKRFQLFFILFFTVIVGKYKQGIEGLRIRQETNSGFLLFSLFSLEELFRQSVKKFLSDKATSEIREKNSCRNKKKFLLERNELTIKP